MLWYKAWLETRSRFLTCLATLTIFCAVFVRHAQGLIGPGWTADYNRLLFVTQQFLVIMWILAVVLLGMGGIVREGDWHFFVELKFARKPRTSPCCPCGYGSP